MDFLTNNLGLLAGGTSAGIALWLLTRIPNEKIYSTVEKCGFALGSLLTLRLSKMRWSRDIWASTVEPWIIDAFDNIVGAFTQGVISGLKSDD